MLKYLSILPTHAHIFTYIQMCVYRQIHGPKYARIHRAKYSLSDRFYE